MVRSAIVAPLLLGLWALSGVACNAILGIEETRVAPSGDAGLVCTEPTETDCSGTCVDTTGDAANCGACGHDCGGGTCSEGKCQAVPLAEAVDGPFSLAVTPSGEQVFWMTSIGVFRCPIAGCGAAKPTRIAEAGVAFTGTRNRLVATNDEVFWPGRTNMDVLFSCPTAGCIMQVPTVKTGHTLDLPRTLTMAGTAILVAQKFQATLCQQAGGCAAVSCATSDSMQSAVADDEKVYWLETTDPAGLYSCPRGGGANTRMTQESGRVVKLQGDVLYVLRQFGDSIYRCGKAGCSGAGTPLVTGQAMASSMTVDSDGIYWTIPGADATATGELRTCPLAGCPASGPIVLATGLARPTDVTVQGKDVLWVNQGLVGVVNSGAVMRVRK
jgi:hypothetical protein